MSDESELKDLIFGMLTFHYDQAEAEADERFRREVIGDLSNFKPIGILSNLGDVEVVRVAQPPEDVA